MADTTTITNGKAKLPPLSPVSKTDDGSTPKKKVVRKKKKPAAEGEATKDGEEVKPTPRRRKAAASASSTQAEGGESATTTPKKKKKKATPRKTAEDGEPTSARSAGSQGDDVTGSKASLISKGTKGGTPRKKKVKKKVKKTTGTADGADEYLDSTLVADLSEIQEDIVTEDADEGKDYKKEAFSTTAVVLKSQPTEKFYIETDRGFKGENKTKFQKRTAEEEAEKAFVKEEPKKTTIAFALSTHRVLKTFFLFCHGMLAGLSAWHIVMSYVLLNFGNFDFIEHYEVLALPVQCIFYILLVICTVSVCDRFDVSNPNRRFLLQAVTLQNGAISVLFYFAALIVSTSNFSLDDKIAQYDSQPALWNNTQTADDDLQTWSGLNTTRGILAILGWFVLSITPTVDRLTQNLEKSDSHILGDSAEIQQGGSVV